jgi:hypothetical protein
MSSSSVRVVLALALWGAAPPAFASVQVFMTVEGSRGPIGSGDPGTAPTIKLTSVQLDLFPSVSVPLSSPKAVVVTRQVDALSAPLLDALAGNEPLRVVITTVRSSSVSGMPQRRVIRLTGARIVTLHAALDATTASRSELGSEAIAFSYERIEVEDDGVRVFASGA